MKTNLKADLKTAAQSAIYLSGAARRVRDWHAAHMFSSDPYWPFNHQHRAIFIHVPKTGSQAIQRALFGKVYGHHHHSAVQYRAADPEKFAAYCKFAFLRHPLDRLVSAFAYYTRSSRYPPHIAFAQRHFADLPDFAHFLKALANPWFRAKLFTATHFRPQAEFVADHRGVVLVDDLYRFDDMAAGVAALSPRFEGAGELVMHNASQRRNDWRDYYDAAGKRLAERVYAADFEIYESIPPAAATLD